MSSSITDDKFNESLDILLLLEDIISNDNIKRNLENRMTYIFLMYLKNPKYKNSITNDKIKQIASIIYQNKIKYIPEYSNERKVLIKKIYIRLMSLIYSKK